MKIIVNTDYLFFALIFIALDVMEVMKRIVTPKRLRSVVGASQMMQNEIVINKIPGLRPLRQVATP